MADISYFEGLKYSGNLMNTVYICSAIYPCKGVPLSAPADSTAEPMQGLAHRSMARSRVRVDRMVVPLR